MCGNLNGAVTAVAEFVNEHEIAVSLGATSGRVTDLIGALSALAVGAVRRYKRRNLPLPLNQGRYHGD
jgi:hypothetical protein